MFSYKRIDQDLPTVYDFHHAVALAVQLNEGEEDGWEYIVRRFPNGKAQIEAHDEHGEVLGYF